MDNQMDTGNIGNKTQEKNKQNKIIHNTEN